MKAKIEKVSYIKEFEGKHGILHSFAVQYDGKKAFYNSKSKDQKKFVVGQEAEFTEIEKESAKGKYLIIKPIYANQGFSNFGKAQAREKSKYSGFAMSYAKDLVIGGRIPIEEMKVYAGEMFEYMVALDKSLES